MTRQKYTNTQKYITQKKKKIDISPWLQAIVLGWISLMTLTITLSKMKECWIPEKCLMSNMLLLFWQQFFENNIPNVWLTYLDWSMQFPVKSLWKAKNKWFGRWNNGIYLYKAHLCISLFILSHSCHFIQFNHESLSFNMINKVIPKQLQGKTNKMSLGR